MRSNRKQHQQVPQQPTQEEKRRLPFQDDSERSTKSNLKINNESSAVSAPGPTQKQRFDSVAEQVHARSEEYKKQAYELGKKFIRMVEDKILPENKGPTAKSVESQIINELLMLGVAMNTDQTQEEGMGGIGIVTLLIKGMLYQRDRINNLQWRLDKTEAVLRRLENDPLPSVAPAQPVAPIPFIRQPNPFAPEPQNEPIRASRVPEKNPLEE